MENLHYFNLILESIYWKIKFNLRDTDLHALYNLLDQHVGIEKTVCVSIGKYTAIWEGES